MREGKVSYWKVPILYIMYSIKIKHVKLKICTINSKVMCTINSTIITKITKLSLSCDA